MNKSQHIWCLMGALSGLDHKHGAAIPDFWFSVNEVQNRIFRMKREQAVSIPIYPACWSMQWFSAQICRKGQVCKCVGSWSEFGRKKVYQNVNQIKVK